MREQILYYAVKYKGEWKYIQKAIEANEPWEKIEYNGNFVTVLDKEYPEKLRKLQYAPWILFYEGNLALLDRKSAGIIGSRDASEKGVEMCRTLCRHLSNKYVVVSGLAKGIDSIAHQCSLNRGTIGVIGCGLDVIYPKQNEALYKTMRKNHLILSEYHKGVAPLAFHFPWRNRILAALSDVVIVVEAKKRSGSMLTVNEALALDIPVYCMPHAFGDAYGEGGNLLIAQGAGILSDITDIELI